MGEMMKTNGKRRCGFTLVDLLVAIAILTVVMGAVATLLWGSVKAVRTGTANIEANEEQRALLRSLERDLNSAFADRDFGSYYQFYGTPIGCVYVGVVRAYEYGSTSKPNLARVTYVLHRSVGAKTIPQPDGSSLTSYALLRYVESNQKDLDSFPIDWNVVRGNIEFPGVDAEFTAIEQLANAGWEPYVVQDLLRAKKRQLWIRMLSGGEGNNLPDGWVLLGRDPRDYVLVENILLPTPPAISYNDKSYSGPVFFEYGLTDASTIVFRPFWNADYNIPGTQPFYAGTTTQDLGNPLFQATGPESLAPRVGTPLNPRLPEVIRLSATLRYKSPYPGAPDTLREFTRVMDVPCGTMRSVPSGT